MTTIEAQANGLPILFSNVCSKEIYATELIRKMRLSDSAEKWADAGNEMIRKTERGIDVAKQLREAGLTEDTMQHRIYHVLEGISR